MNKTAVISGVCGFVLGAGVGTGATTLYFHRQIKSIKQQIEDFQAELDELYSQFEEPVVVNPAPERDPESVLAGERAKANWAGKENYHKKYEEVHPVEENADEIDASGEVPVEDDEESEDEDEEGPHNMHPLDSHEDDVIYQTEDMRVGVRCWVVDETEVGDFMMDNDGWDEETLVYYRGCGTLEDAEICSVLHDDGYYVGDCLETSGFTDNEERVIYIANDSLATLYRVEKLDGTYASWNGED